MGRKAQPIKRTHKRQNISFMKHIFLLLACLFMMIGITSAQKAEVLTNKSIIDLYQAGLDNDVIISKIEASECKFNLSTTGLLSLKKAAVPSDVMKAMMAKGNDKPHVPVGITPAVHPVAAKEYPDIDMMNIPHRYDGKANTLKDLEKAVVTIKGKITIGSVFVPGSSAPITFKIDGEKSTVRVTGTDSALFMVNSGNGTPDIFKLYSVTPKKGKREGLYMKQHTMKMEIENGVVPFSYKKVKEGIYEIIPNTKLQPGEYCLMNSASIGTYGGTKADVYAFGID